MEPPPSVLIPVANPETVAQFVHLGARIAKKEAFQSTLFSVVGDAGGGSQSFLLAPSRVELVFEVQEDTARELGAWSARYDRMILGTSRNAYSGGPVFEKLQLEIARSSRCPVVFVRPKEKGARFNY